MTRESNGSGDDLELRRRILEGLAAGEELAARFHQPLERFLVGSCERGDGISRGRAVEFAAKIVGDCFKESPSLLEKWDGSGSLEAFLWQSGRNLLKSWWRSPEYKRVKEQEDAGELSLALQNDGEEVEEAEVARAAEGLCAGVKRAMDDAPEGLAFLRLKGLHGVNQRVIARCWGLDESQITRRIEKAMKAIHETAATFTLEDGRKLPFSAFQTALQRDPSILLGREDGGGDPPDDALLAGVAGGAADKQARLAAAKAMCRDHRSLALFAGLLNRGAGHGPAVAKDPALDGMEARLTECLRRTLELLRPADAAALVTPLMSASFADALALTGADGGTLWLVAPGEAALEAVFNPLEPEMTGMRQPLVSGIVSLVLATGEPACVADLSAHRRHSPAVDVALSKTTRAMIAVPFQIGGSVRGVVTAVRFARAGIFGEKETAVLARHAEIMAGLMTRAIEERILATRPPKKK